MEEGRRGRRSGRGKDMHDVVFFQPVVKEGRRGGRREKDMHDVVFFQPVFNY